MRLMILVLAASVTIFASSEALAITTYSSSPFRTITVATATVPDRDNAPLYFSILSGSGEVQGVAPGDEIYYQYKGTSVMTILGKTLSLPMESGAFLYSGKTFSTVPEVGDQFSTYLLFRLSSGDRSPDKLGRYQTEIYRSRFPISGLMPTTNVFSLIRVKVPPQSPCDPMHRRSGAALHYVLSGTGAEFTENRAIARGPGSISYEPNSLLYQWSNPGSTPLVYLLLNVNPKSEPVVVGSSESMDPFVGNPHITWAIYCVGFSMILTALVSARVGMDGRDGRRSARGGG
jgi:mannose-6-phosphate isomerase-like protein (cupin superfamily)